MSSEYVRVYFTIWRSYQGARFQQYWKPKKTNANFSSPWFHDNGSSTNYHRISCIEFPRARERQNGYHLCVMLFANFYFSLMSSKKPKSECKTHHLWWGSGWGGGGGRFCDAKANHAMISLSLSLNLIRISIGNYFCFFQMATNFCDGKKER